jgi:hypothetical protein
MTDYAVMFCLRESIIFLYRSYEGVFYALGVPGLATDKIESPILLVAHI